MNFLRQVRITVEDDSNTISKEKPIAFLNKFSEVEHSHVRKHLSRLSAFIESYNQAARPDERWTLQRLNELTTLSGPGSENHNW